MVTNELGVIFFFFNKRLAAVGGKLPNAIPPDDRMIGFSSSGHIICPLDRFISKDVDDGINLLPNELALGLY